MYRRTDASGQTNAYPVSSRVALDDLNPGTNVRIVSEGTAPEDCIMKGHRWDLSLGLDPEVCGLASE